MKELVSPPDSARPEHALLLAAARSALRPAVRAEPPPGEVDWDAFLALAARNRLLPLAHRLLADRAEVPGTVRSRLRAAAADAGHRALARAGELRRLIGAMDAAGVRAVAYKGPALAVRAYGDLALRTYADLDLLVAPEDVAGAARVLEGRGYVSAHRFSPAQDAVFRRTDGDYPFHHPRTAALVELHCHVSSARFCVRLPTAQLIARARPVPIGGGQVPALADDDLFLALCLHGAKHRWARLEWLTAAAALALRAGLELEAIHRRASAIGAGRTVRLALLLARDALGLAPPPSTQRSISADATLAALAAEARALWFAAPAEDGTAANLRFNYRLREGAADRARYAARWLFTPSPEDWAWACLPDALSPLYRALRPLRLALRYGPRRGG
ncbi:MAG: nucleotidyltransferase family protein [Gemmatimonadetes bacterium]|nr:nucleotidyltransferase family protein [Gemmatimonadota bacterium]